MNYVILAMLNILTLNHVFNTYTVRKTELYGCYTIIVA